MANLAVDHLSGEFGLTAKIKDALLETRKQFVYIQRLAGKCDAEYVV